MSDVKQVKVDNWGIYFLQRLKHFFNRTDYCDLTLQFQDNAQLKVHRLVLSACTEYFELLERTCEMYEDCLVMPDDLQADVVVPIVNFMYTGQLEFKMDLLERLYQTSQIMNMPVLSKLLEAHRSHLPVKPPTHNYSQVRNYSRSFDGKSSKQTPQPVASSSNARPQKRSYSKTFEKKLTLGKKPQEYDPMRSPSPIPLDSLMSSKKLILGDPRPTRYELPEELDVDNIFDNSFTNISYTSQPLMVHPETSKRYSAKKTNRYGEASTSKKYNQGPTTLDIVECKKITKPDNIFEEVDSIPDETELFQSSITHYNNDSPKDTNQLFDQILDNSNDGPKVTIEAKDNKSTNNLDHAKIISEVLKKYPHLVKSNKNIKLKILNAPTPSKNKKPSSVTTYNEEKEVKLKSEPSDFTYETDVLDSKEAARLIALGAENVKGPWICLICGTPGKALHFTSYYKFRQHLVTVHNEKPIATMCEYCGLKSHKRNYLLHHLYTKHGIPPPPSYHFPKCNYCNYVALTEGLLVKHKMTHSETRSFRCNVCASTFSTSNLLLVHIQKTGHKYSADRKTNLQCIYCLKVFLRETNLYAHLKTNHKQAAKEDGVIDDSDEEKCDEPPRPQKQMKMNYDNNEYDNDMDEMETQYQVQQKVDNIHALSKKAQISASTPKQKILNTGFGIIKKTTNLNSEMRSPMKTIHKPKHIESLPSIHTEFGHDIKIDTGTDHNEEIVIIDGNQYIMKDNQLLIKREVPIEHEFVLPDMIPKHNETLHTAPVHTEFTQMHNVNTEENIQQSKMITKKPTNLSQPIQIVVSNEEEYKALMASNHSIIFDDGDSNKTLTVLTAPHGIDSTAIDLNNTQSNDMMIIQEDYPLNVSETVSADNSKIVVVYSHPVGDQSKQYQLITSQGIGTQFVQSSAVITQNYETVTTSTPVMSAHVIDTPVQEVWQSNVQDNVTNQQMQMASVTTVHVADMPVTEHAEIAQTVNMTENTLSDLPEVSILPDSVQETTAAPQQEQMNPMEVTLNQAAVLMNENIGQNIEAVTDLQNITSNPMDIDIPSEIVVENDQIAMKPHEEEQEVQQTEIIAGNSEIEPSEVEQQTQVVCAEMEVNVEKIPDMTENYVTSEIVENTPDEAENTPDEVENAPHEIENIPHVVENTPHEIENTPHEIENIPHDIENTSQEIETENEIAEPEEQPPQAPIDEATKEQIENLASEWSEDEGDTVSTQETVDVNDNASKTIPATEQSNDASMLEETIDNIQSHIEKQALEATAAEPEVETEESISSQEDLTNIPVECTNSTALVSQAPQEKISSLLNDWDENDSQDENEPPGEGAPANENEVGEHSEADTDKAADPGETLIDNSKKDNIKSLVSDWDDEEEEIKE